MLFVAGARERAQARMSFCIFSETSGVSAGHLKTNPFGFTDRFQSNGTIAATARMANTTKATLPIKLLLISDPLHKVDDAVPELFVFNLRKRLRESESI